MSKAITPLIVPGLKQGHGTGRQVVALTQVVHPLELLGDCHGASRLDCDYHPDCITKEVPSGLMIMTGVMTKRNCHDECDEAILF